MKILSVKNLAALATTAAMSVGTASAMGLDSGVKPLTSVTGISSTNVRIKIDDGVATLFGYVDSSHESALAKSYAQKIEGVDKVINRIVSN